MDTGIYWRAATMAATGRGTVARGNHAGHIAVDDHPNQPRAAHMSWALDEFYAAVEEEFGVPVGDDGYLETPGAVIDFIVENTSPSDGMTGDEYRDHVAGVVGEIMARTLGVTRYREDSHFVEDLHIR